MHARLLVQEPDMYATLHNKQGLPDDLTRCRASRLRLESMRLCEIGEG